MEPEGEILPELRTGRGPGLEDSEDGGCLS